jgi:hypothetical protein
MSDVNRKPNELSIHNVHVHKCPECERNYSCNCAAQPTKEQLICRDCEQKGA